MPKNKASKKLLSGVMAAAMTASALMAGMTSLTAYAGQELGHGDFNDGAGLPWHICESATGTMKFEIADGCYNILITNPGGLSNNGEGRWDCQFRHRGLTIEEGHTYRITYSVWTDDTQAKIYAKLGDMTNDDKEMWHGNGTVLNLKYSDVEGKDMAGIETALKAASSGGQTIEYGMGWDAWKNSTLPSNQWTTYAYEFQPQGSAEGVGEWTFHLGGTSNYNDFICVNEGKVIKFDNMCLIDMTDDKSDYKPEDEYVATGIEVNQIGYFTKLAKKATLVLGESPDTTAKAFQVKNSSGATVYEGTTTGGGTLCDASNTYNQVIDFSDLREEGTGFYIECDGKKSLPFDIGDKIYGNLTTEAMNYFYQNRSGVDIEAQYIASANPNGAKASATDLAREAGHTKDIAYVQSKWVYIIPTDADCETSKSVDVSGGWYDAGDHGKYVVNGGVSIWTLLSMFDRDVNKGDISKWDDNGKTVVVPEAGNNIPDILDEVQWEIDFFKKMQDPADGMVYHKIHDYKWTALAVSPADATARTAAGELTRIIKPKTYAATLNFAAALAQYSRLIKPYNESEASDCLALAEKAYKAAKDCYKPYTTIPDQNADHESLYAPLTQNKGGGPYGDTNVTDEFYWAACELYITSGDASYKTDLMSYDDKSGKYFDVPTLLYGGENNGSCSAFTWGTVGSLGTLSLSINGADMVAKGLLTADELTTIQNSVKSAADYYLKLEEESDFGVPYVGHDYETTVWTLKEGEVKKTLKNGYEWGSNSMVVNNAMVMGLAYDIDHEAKYISGVSTAMDYIFGRNLLEFSYVSGYGENSLSHPHHRWWSNQLDSSFPSCPVGVLSGGNNSEMQDPMIQGKGYKAGEVAPMLCYIDNVEAWSVNECTINWNSPLVWISSFLEDEAPNVDFTGTTPSKDTTTTTTTTTTSGSDTTTSGSNTTTTTTTKTSNISGDVLIGDTNLDGTVSMIDVIYLNKYLAGVIKFNDQQMANAQCAADGQINSGDTMALLKYLVHKVETLPVQA
ncbi:MAG: glycoside hydrolase family 9 protein [Oscillospiraceae bacterium]|nr:glycoside hydrolase family 9 protein [Oscillospiraceae bacterium]